MITVSGCVGKPRVALPEVTLARKDRVRLRGAEVNRQPKAGAEGKLFVAGKGRGLCDNQLPRIVITCLALCLTPALPYHLIPS